MMGENPSSELLYLGFCLGFNESEVRAKIGKEHWVVVFEGRRGGSEKTEEVLTEVPQ